MRVPPIDRNKVLDAIDLFSVKGSEKPNSDKTTMQVGSGFDSSVNITISEEGKRILSEDRENLSKYGINTTRFEVIEFGDIDVSGELMMEYYWAMNKALSSKIHDAEDSARNIMSQYEALYHNIMEMHKTGDREYSSLYGKGMLTLEEDLEGLDKAFEMKLAGLKGYISYRQSIKVLGKVDLSIPKTGTYVPGIYDFRDPQYVEDLIEMMKRAKKEFEESYQSRGYQKFTGSNIISRIISENPEFSFKTKLLFFEVK